MAPVVLEYWSMNTLHATPAKKPLMVGNWKMKPATLKDAKAIYQKIAKVAGTFRNVDIVVAPPAVFLSELKRTSASKKIKWSAQDSFIKREASATGELSPSQLKSVGVSYVILGHSERRALGDTNEQVRAKMDAALAEGLAVILCIGEHERDRSGEYLGFLEAQLTSAFKGRARTELDRIIVAYEPLWAIGKSAKDAHVQARDVHEMIIFVRKYFADRYGKAVADERVVLYGGSAEPVNAAMLLRDGHADGLLIGHASIVPHEFVEMLSIANTL